MDDVDKTQERSDVELGASIESMRQLAARIPKGQPGDCYLCGEWSGRLVKGACAPCRDKHGLE